MASIRSVSGKFQVQVRKAGIRQTKTFSTEEEAKLWAWRIEAPVNRKKNPVQKRPDTLGEIIDLYKEIILPTHRSGALEKNILLHLEGHWLCEIKCKDLGVFHLAKYRDERLAKVKVNTIKRAFNMLKPMIDIARDEWNCEINGNPARELKIRTVDDSRKRRLTSAEMNRLLKEVDLIKNKHVVNAIYFALETSMRRSEILSLTVEDIDFNNRIARLNQTKNGTSRSVALTPRAITLLEAGSKQGWIFPCTASAIRCSFTRAVQRAGIGSFCFHQLRHEAISRMWEMGLNSAEISNQSGHKDWKMLQRYSHVDASNLSDKLKSITM